VFVEFAGKPVVGAAVPKCDQKCGLDSLCSGQPVYEHYPDPFSWSRLWPAIRANRRALKVLGANSWVQEGETDISPKNQRRGFLVSELIEAYDRNIPHGIEGMFNVVLSANLDPIPVSILRNYTLEGKSLFSWTGLRLRRWASSPSRPLSFRRNTRLRRASFITTRPIQSGYTHAALCRQTPEKAEGVRPEASDSAKKHPASGTRKRTRAAHSAGTEACRFAII